MKPVFIIAFFIAFFSNGVCQTSVGQSVPAVSNYTRSTILHGNIPVGKTNTPPNTIVDVTSGKVDSLLLQNTYLFVNNGALIDKKIQYYYVYNQQLYGTYDGTNSVARFKYLGLSLCLLVTSIYLFVIANRVYHSYFVDKKQVLYNIVFGIVVLFFNVSGTFGVLQAKGLPLSLLVSEAFFYPNQFVLGIVLSSVLLLGIGCFRFTVLLTFPNSEEKTVNKVDNNVSRIAIAFSLVNLLANFATIWMALKS
jgi:hypothetical protein